MDGETYSDGPRENQQGLQKDITMEVENLLVEAKNIGTEGLQEKLDDSKKQHNGILSGRTDAELQWSDSSGSLSAHAVYVFSDEWTMRREEEMNTTSLLENWACPDSHSTMAEGHRDPAESLSMPLVLSRSDLSDLYTQAGLAVPNLSSKPSSPIASSRFVTSPTTDALKFASRRSSGDPVSAAAHLHLLGESLSLIGQHLQETNFLLFTFGFHALCPGSTDEPHLSNTRAVGLHRLHTGMSKNVRENINGSSDLRLFLLGNIGCGKTLSANTILNQPSSRSTNDTKSCQLREAFTEGRRVTLVEAPRWYWAGEKVDDSVRKETEQAVTLMEPDGVPCACRATSHVWAGSAGSHSGAVDLRRLLDGKND
ncbi:HMG box-containing protein 4 [Oryzias melastigma]|uniref:HMG box-containing protein 4 n=1 Tax=Oryzias melastigma TaxID=30732 RepID=A0A834C194_ORYME|nr:HMG box-containing protein 4 [Oryzias melastigma]